MSDYFANCLLIYLSCQCYIVLSFRELSYSTPELPVNLKEDSSPVLNIFWSCQAGGE